MSIIGTKAIEAVWLINTEVSAACELGGHSVERITIPAGWTAADITFQISDDGGTTWQNLYWDWGAEMVVDAAASTIIELSPFVKLSNIDQLRIRSGTAAAEVTQLAAVTAILSVSTRG